MEILDKGALDKALTVIGKTLDRKNPGNKLLRHQRWKLQRIIYSVFERVSINMQNERQLFPFYFC